MSQQNQTATGGDNGQGNGSGTAADQTNQGAGQQQQQQQQGSQSGTAADTNQGAGAGNGGKITFSPEQQTFINNLVKSESEKAITKAKGKWDEQQKLSEDERVKAELAETRSQLAERDRRDTVREAAEKAGVKNPRLFYNAYKDELETDDKGKITNLKEVLEAAKSEAPELFGATNNSNQSNGSADGGAGKTPTGLAVTREQFDKMTNAQKLEFSAKGGTISG